MDQNFNDFLGLPREEIQGIGVGKTETGADRYIVYTTKKTLSFKIPKEFNGVTVDVAYVGKITPAS